MNNTMCSLHWTPSYFDEEEARRGGPIPIDLETPASLHKRWLEERQRRGLQPYQHKEVGGGANSDVEVS